MELLPEARILLTQRLNEWNAVLQARNNIYSTFHNSAGWRRYYCQFYPIEEISVDVQYSEKYRTFLAEYSFKQDHFITAPFSTEEVALKCNDFFKRNTGLHVHQAIFQNEDWIVQERAVTSNVDKPEESRFKCDRFVSKGGVTKCVNDYHCRETSEIADILKGNAFVAPMECSLLSCDPTATIEPSIMAGGLRFKIYDYSDDDAKSVEITFFPEFVFTLGTQSYSANTSIRFMETGLIGLYKKPVKTKLKKTLVPLLKSALFNTRLLLEKKLGDMPDDTVAFPDDAKGLERIYNALWSKLEVDYY